MRMEWFSRRCAGPLLRPYSNRHRIILNPSITDDTLPIRRRGWPGNRPPVG